VAAEPGLIPPWWWWPLAYAGGVVAGLAQFAAGLYLATVVMRVAEGEREE